MDKPAVFLCATADESYHAWYLPREEFLCTVLESTMYLACW